MAKKCVVCNKQVGTGNTVSHSNNRHRTKIRPNLQSMKIILKNGQVSTEWVCTKCLKSGRVKKSVKRKKTVAA